MVQARGTAGQPQEDVLTRGDVRAGRKPHYAVTNTAREARKRRVENTREENQEKLAD